MRAVSPVLPDTATLGHNPRVLTFPQLSRKPALKTRGTMLDPTLRDSYENGMEATRARFTRTRRQWEIAIDALTPADVKRLQDFVELQAVYGANPFLFTDVRDPRNPEQVTVRFSVLPAYMDAGNVAGEFRQNATFSLREI
jgi:hypothetical protein